MPFLAFSLPKSLILLHLLFLRLLRYLLLGVLACKKNSCYFCDVCGLFEVLLGHFFVSTVWNLVKIVIAVFAIFVTRYFKPTRKILVTFAIFETFANISTPFLTSSLSKSRILLHLLFLRFFRYLSSMFLARKKNPSYFCEFCGICGHFVALLGFFSF